MKAVAYQTCLPIEHPDSLQDIELDDPIATGRDLLVEVRAVSVNPVDSKVRHREAPTSGQWRILGWDGVGTVRAVGAEVTLFKPGDKVWYAGDITRQGTNAELHLVDERIVGRMPKTLDCSQAAALPLTSITAWEMLFDRLGLVPGKKVSGERLLIIGAAGGVGSIMTQLARRLTGVTVIGTASRPETREWLLELGAHHVIDHNQSLLEGLHNIGCHQVSHIVSLNKTDLHYPEIVEAIAPQGKFGLIDDPGPLDISLLKGKSVSLHWELMFTRSKYHTSDMIAQHHLLNEMAELVDAGLIRTTLVDSYAPINAANLKQAHAFLESGKARGKIVIAGF
jgi:zinc-binding alcohol dehydrogenase family protein